MYMSAEYKLLIFTKITNVTVITLTVTEYSDTYLHNFLRLDTLHVCYFMRTIS